MPWEVYEKVVRRSTSPMLTISKLGRLSFNAPAADVLTKHGMTHVLLLWDKTEHRIGIRAVAKKDSRSYILHFAPKNAHAGFAAKTFLDHISYDFSHTKGFPCEWNEKELTYEVTIPVENFRTKPIQRFPRLATGKKGTEAHGQAKAEAAQA